MKISEEQFKKCEELSKLRIDSDKRKTIIDEMSAFISYADEVAEIEKSTNNFSCLVSVSELAQDEVKEYDRQDALAECAAQKKDGFYKVRKTV